MELLHGNLQLGDKIILQDFSLSLPSQGVLCLSGPSGCGKTSLLRVLAGLTPLNSGSITHMLDSRMVFQEDRLIPWLSVEANLTAASGISQAEARRWLRLCGLEQEYHARPGSLSGGMRRRVAIVRALAAPSQLLLLDEPFQGLDSDTKSLLYPAILEAAAEKPVVIATHHLEEARALGAAVLHLDGPPLQVLSSE